MKGKNFRNVQGIHIRRQYFNYILFALLLIFLYFFIMRSFAPMLGGG